MYDHVVKCQRAGLCLSEHFLIMVCGHRLLYVFRIWKVVDKSLESLNVEKYLNWVLLEYE